MTTELTDQDRKVLKYEKRMGFVFLGLILCFGGLFNLVYFVMTKEAANQLMVALIDIGIILSGLLVCYLVNKNINLDLKENRKELLIRTVDKKLEEQSHEAGSGASFIPILGNLFPKLWGQKMKETRKYIIVADEYNYEVDKEIYNELEEGSTFIIHFAKNSSTTLSYSKDK